ncbi:MAG: FtsX-like permease family protein [Gemmatimonadaceae bacterium]|nr:FtsX-like permease family protein [Gemmatimonadaceae bacterium]
MSWWNPFSRDPKRTFALPPSPARVAAEVDEELRFHMEERRAELIAAGLSTEQADAEMRRRFGDAEAYRRQTAAIDHVTIRQERRAHFVTTLRRETRHSARALVRDRGFSVVAGVTLALGIGATAAMFAVLDAVVLRPLPYADADRLVSVMHPAVVPGSGPQRWGVSPGGYIHFKRDARTLADFGIYRTFTVTVTSGGDAELARVAMATHEVAGILGARAELGRLLGDEDDRPGAARRVMLSHEYHQRRFGGDPAVVGTMLETAFGNYEIVGVTTPGVALPMPGPFAEASDLRTFGVDVWMMQRIDPAGPFWNNHPNVGVGRLRAGSAVESANAEFATLLARFPEQMPNAYSAKFLTSYGFGVEVAPLQDAVLGAKVPRALWMLFGSVLVVLLIAAANVGNLFLVRFEARRREAAVRAALGADRGQMAAHYLSESLLLCGTASVAALGVAWAALRLVLLVAPTDVPRLAAVTLDARTAGVALAIGLAIGVVLGILPLLRRDVDVGALREASRGMSASPRRRAARHALVVAQVALSLMLLAATGLLWRSFAQLRAVAPGFDTDRTLVFNVSLPFVAYDTPEKAIVAHRALHDAFAAIPGVRSVGAGSVPLRDFASGCTVVYRESRPYGPDEETPCVASASVLPGWFETLGIRVDGATSTWRDLDARTQPAVVTRALADRLWPGEDPIGRGIGSNGPDAKAFYHVVGVVPSVHLDGLDAKPTEAVLYPATSLIPNERGEWVNDVAFFLRTDGRDPLSLLPQVRDAVRRIDARVPIIEPTTFEAVAARSIARTSFTLALLGLAGVLGLVLSAVGLYGVVSYLVQQRRSELGLRLALGDTAAGVRRLVVLQSLRLGVVGVVIGLVGAMASNRALEAMLFEVRAMDPVVLVGVALLLLGTVTFASLGPAGRAARIEPGEAMRG